MIQEAFFKRVPNTVRVCVCDALDRTREKKKASKRERAIARKQSRHSEKLGQKRGNDLAS